MEGKTHWTDEQLQFLANMSAQGLTSGAIHLKFFPNHSAGAVASAISRAKKKFSIHQSAQVYTPPIMPPQLPTLGPSGRCMLM